MNRIGIVGYRNEHGNFFGAAVTYLSLISHMGAVAQILAPDEDVRQDLDLLLLPGGLDAQPLSYGETPGYNTSNHDVFKEHFFKERLPRYMEQQTPIFGICLGFQMLNVALGGTLDQHMPFHPNSPNRWVAGHKVRAVRMENGRLVHQRDVKLWEVNSHHHQGVRIKNLAPDLNITHIHEHEEGMENTIVEAFEHSYLPIAGVQWHPEEWYDGYSINTMQRLMESSLVQK